MRRSWVLIGLLCILGILVTMFGPWAARLLLMDLPAQLRGEREMARREQYREEHPPEPLLSTREPELILHAASARAVRIYRLNPEADSTCTREKTGACFEDHRVLGRVPVQSMDWGERFLAEVLSTATEFHQPPPEPRFGIRFIGVSDTTAILLDTNDSPRNAVLLFRWKDSLGRRRQATAHMPFRFEGDPDADSTLTLLRHLPFRF